ncbi:MAG TPA: DNA recombination protein RmuC [Steroidobacteraceae bacterium]|jgi:DNA recombination protein RmuC|nr:DNA recombination protein RmuC [Steroidobacteraceae bacterium]
MNVLWIVISAVAAGVIGYLLGALRAARRAETLRAQLAEATTKLATEEQALARNAELLRQSEAQVRLAIESSSRAALDANSQTFIKLANEIFGRNQESATASLAAREEAIKQLVEPLKVALARQEEQTQALERERRESSGKLSGQIENLVKVQDLLQRETRNLSTALRRPEVRGRWGEITLRRVVELAGMSEHCDFTEQEQVVHEGGALRPDLLVRMPEERSIVVDAKTPLDAYLAAIEAPDDDSRRVALARHARQVEERVRELGRKSYWEQFEHSPEFAVLFLPGDQFLSAALAESPDLIDNALKQRIIVTTPSTLMALLKVIAYGWRQSRVTENAREIRELGQDLHRRLSIFVGHLQKVGKSFGSAIEAFNSAVGSMERNVLPQARKFTELGASTDPPVEPVDPIEKGVRVLTTTPALESDEPAPPRNPS